MSTVDIPDADRYDVDLDIEEAAVRRARRITPDDVAPADALTFARNVFIPLTTACRYTCTYCTFYDPPGRASLLTPDEVRGIARRGVEAGCTEALFTLGDEPDKRYERINRQLEAMGHASIHEYLAAACELALEEGLLPHSNPGDQTREQMATSAPYNASMGVMLETTAEVRAHAGPRGKSPGQRLATIRAAGELQLPFTTGILVGIGESMTDRATSLLAIRALHERHDHVQEVIVQPVVENDRWRGGSPDLETLRQVTAMARGVLPEEVSVQVPPNLAPVRELLDCGIDDLGGVSPVTVDHVNPAYAWPALDELEAIAATAEVPLRERLPVYRRFVPEEVLNVDDVTTTRWLDRPVLESLTANTPAGRRFRGVLRGDEPVG
ncbi:MAG: 7,8-didemethyl-8-hydroxy-5-deazariboflavin synthase subunit CofG [Halobacteriota archaeon]